MKQKSSVIKIVTLIICTLLILSAGVLTLLGGSQSLGINSGRPSGNFTRDNMKGDFSPPSGDGSDTRLDGSNMQPPSGDDIGNWSGQQGQFPEDFQGRGNRYTAQSKLLIVARYAVGVLVILFGVLAAVGTWINRKWGKVMAVITAVIVLTYTIPTVFNTMRGANLYFNIANIVLSIALVVLAFVKGTKPTVEEEQISVEAG